MKTFEVWRTGYKTSATTFAPAKKLGSAEAETFAEACEIVCGTANDFDKKQLTVWGCQLFDNEDEARNFLVRPHGN